jgi:hypothetical protein
MQPPHAGLAAGGANHLQKQRVKLLSKSYDAFRQFLNVPG